MTSFLIVDDEPDVRALVELILLPRDGAVVATVGSATEAREHLKTVRTDVMLLDVTMPEIDGPGLLRQLREEGLEPEFTYLLSAVPRSKLEELSEGLGVRFISKPFTVEELLVALAEHF